MKPTIKPLLFFIYLLFTSSVLAHTSINLYASKLGIIGLSESDSEYSLIAITGGQPDGASTAGDCAITAILTERNSHLAGTLAPFKSKYFSYEEDQSGSKSITLKRRADAIVLEDVDTLGICGLGTTFIDIYYPTSAETTKYKENYIELLNLAHEIAKARYKNKDMLGAASIMRAYAENLPMQWISEPSQAGILPEFLNNYAFFLQQAGQPKAAITILNDLLEVKPDRIVAWLNLADAYWDAKKYSDARKCYEKYKQMMKANNRETGIPKRVNERIKADRN